MSALHRFGRLSWLIGALMVAVSMALSNFGMSLGQFILLGGFLLSEDLPERLRTTIRHPLFLLPAGLYAIHLAGMWNTENLAFGMHDLRVKLPLLLLPALFAGAPQGMSQRYPRILLAVVAGTLLATGYGFFSALAGKIAWGDYRAFSPFISHIRLSLLIVFSICILADGIRKQRGIIIQLLNGMLVLWFLAYLILLGSLTGLAILGLLAVVGLIRTAFITHKRILRISAAALAVICLTGAAFTVHQVFIAPLSPGFPDATALEVQTPRGYVYSHDLNRVDMEQGRYVWVNYSEVEIDSAWKRRSDVLLWEPDAAGNIRLATLLRYLTWLGYPKDADGIAKLTATDIRNIERGFATPEHASSRARIGLRLRELAREVRIYELTGWANGHTFAQRMEYRKAALDISRRHPLSGVGTGDLPAAYAVAYDRIGSSLFPELRLRAHNQYLSLAVANGIPAALFLIAWLIWFGIRMHRQHIVPGMAFLIIVACSFLTEDTLETQAGITFFCFLYSLIGSHSPDEPEGKGVETLSEVA
ncbi:MAG: O-antigen ligase family protein [Bacteroidota bacterium]